MKRALVCGAGGFIGGHLVKTLKREGYWVRGVDIKERQSWGTPNRGAGHEFAESQADEFRLLDLRDPHNCWEALNLCNGETFDAIYQLNDDIDGMEYPHNAGSSFMSTGDFDK